MQTNSFAASSLKAFPLFWSYVSLMENTTKSANRNLLLPWHDHRIKNRPYPPDKLYVTTLLADFCKTANLQAALDFAKGSGLSRPNLNLDDADFGCCAPVSSSDSP